MVSGFLAVDLLREAGVTPDRPVAVAAFADEEGARFGVACVGSRLLTGALAPDVAASLRDADGVSMADAMAGCGVDPAGLGPDEGTLARIGCLVNPTGASHCPAERAGEQDCLAGVRGLAAVLAELAAR